jgi:hypothetical protein
MWLTSMKWSDAKDDTQGSWIFVKEDHKILVISEIEAHKNLIADWQTISVVRPKKRIWSVIQREYGSLGDSNQEILCVSRIFDSLFAFGEVIMTENRQTSVHGARIAKWYLRRIKGSLKRLPQRGTRRRRIIESQNIRRQKEIKKFSAIQWKYRKKQWKKS